MKVGALKFKNGLKDGLPIALGYLSVSFAFGIAAVEGGLKWFAPLLTSLTNFTGTGQFAGISLLLAGAALGEIALTVLIINIRYILMSLVLTQKIDKSFTLPKRLLLAFGNTDEVFGVLCAQKRTLTFSYAAGVIVCSYLGWVSGTALGALAGNILPESVSSALGIALYAMFLAIVLPPAREDRAVAAVALCSAALSCFFYFTPVLSALSPGWRYILCGVAAAGVFTFVFPAGKARKNQKPQKVPLPVGKGGRL